MSFIFRPLDDGAVGLRKYAQRLAATLPTKKGTAHRVQDGYILRAVGDGQTVVVTAIPTPTVLGGAFNGFEAFGVYPGTSTPLYKHAVFHSFSSLESRPAVFAGMDTNLATRDDYRRYVSGGRLTVGSVTQAWPLGFIGSSDDGWLQSPPEFTVQGQCRLSDTGAINATPLHTRTTPCRTALLTLHTPVYRNEYFAGGSVIPTAQERAVALFRLNAGVAARTYADVAPDYPPAIKTDVQADPAARVSGTRGNGLIEFGYNTLGISLTPAGGGLTTTEGAAAPLGCVEWSAGAGVVAVTYLDRGMQGHISVLRYAVTPATPSTPQLGSAVWQVTIDAVPDPTDDDYVAQSSADGVWTTRAGRGVSNGTPDQPDLMLLLTTEIHGTVYNPDPYKYGEAITTRLWRIAPADGSRTSVEIGRFNRYKENLAGGLTEYSYAHLLGITVGAGATELPRFICHRRTTPYWLQTVGDVTERVPRAFNRTALAESAVVSISHTGAVTVLDCGANFFMSYKPSNAYEATISDGVFRLLGWSCFRDVPDTIGLAGYDQPVCEYASGYVVLAVSPNGSWGTDWPVRLVVCDAVTGAKVHESVNVPGLAAKAGTFVGLTCARHGTVTTTEGVTTAAGGVLLITIKHADPLDASSGCYATRDLGVTKNKVLSADVQGVAIHHLGTVLKPAAIGGGQ